MGGKQEIVWVLAIKKSRKQVRSTNESLRCLKIWSFPRRIVLNLIRWENRSQQNRECAVSSNYFKATDRSVTVAVACNDAKCRSLKNKTPKMEQGYGHGGSFAIDEWK